MVKRNIGISLMTCNYLTWTMKCLYALEKYTPIERCKVLIVDNGSTDGTVEYLKQSKWHVIYEKENTGIVDGTNRAWLELLRDEEIEYITRIHNDIIVTEGWLDVMYNIMEEDKSLGRVGIAQVVGNDILGLSVEEINDLCCQFKEDKKGYANLDPVMLRKKMLQDVGILDKIFGKQNCSDCDHNKRMEDKGWGAVGTYKAVVGHGEQVTRLNLPGAEEIREQSVKAWDSKYPGIDRQKYNKAIWKDIKIGALSLRLKGA